MPKYRYIDIDSSLYFLAKSGSGEAKRSVMQLFIDHVESSLPMPDELQNALADVLTKLIPTVKNDKGYHENGLAAWANAMSVHDALKKGKAKSLEDAFAYVAEQIFNDSGQTTSEETIKKHWARFGQWVEDGQMPPFELLGDIARINQGKQK